MKKIFVLAAFTVLFSLNSSVFAQSKGDTTAWKNVTLGPFIMPGASTQAGTVTEGAKSQVMLLSWSAGLVSCFPITPNFAFQFAACYDSRAVGFYQQNKSDNFTNYSFNYFSLRPELKLGAFLIGLGIGIPVGESVDTGGTGALVATPIASSDMNMLLEARVGATSPLFTADNGNVLRFLITASYGLTKITNGPLSLGFSTQTADKSMNNGPFGTLQLGFDYEFNLSPHS